jgi:cell division septation protein DedD
MREAAAPGPCIDIAEVEQRLHSQQAAEVSGRDPLRELARLLHRSETDEQNAGWSLDGSQPYLLCNGAYDDGSCTSEETRESRLRLPKFRTWHAVAGVVALGAVSIGWTFAYRSGGNLAPLDIATIAEPEPHKAETVSVRPEGSNFDNGSQLGAVIEPPLPLSREAALLVNSAQQNATADFVPTITPESPAKTVTTLRAAQPARPKSKKIAAAPENPGMHDNSASSTAASPRGSFAVQFGAADSAAKARQLVQRIPGKFGSQLGGRHLDYRYAKVGNKTFYRVRLRNLSKASAVGICESVKAEGGNCFVAAD